MGIRSTRYKGRDTSRVIIEGPSWEKITFPLEGLRLPGFPGIGPRWDLEMLLSSYCGLRKARAFAGSAPKGEI